MKNIDKLIYFLMILLMISNSFWTCKVSADVGDPNYSVKVHMGLRKIVGKKRVNVGYIISGMGSFDIGYISITSDFRNIVINTYNFKQSVFIGTDYELLDEIDLENMTEQLEIGWGMATRYYEQPTHSIHQMIGNVLISTENMSPGLYTINVVFVVKNLGENYIYQDSITYEIISVVDYYKNNLWFIATIITLSISIYTLAYTKTRLNNQNNEIGLDKQEKEKPDVTQALARELPKSS